MGREPTGYVRVVRRFLVGVGYRSGNAMTDGEFLYWGYQRVAGILKYQEGRKVVLERKSWNKAIGTLEALVVHEAKKQRVALAIRK